MHGQSSKRADPSRRRLAAIMFTDMVGYSALAQADESSALQMLDRHNHLLRPFFPKFRGREIKTVGDAFLVEFESALDATRCALEIQRTLHDYNSASPDEGKIRIRIGIHVGDVVEVDDDLLGDAVNIASRIEALADPEGISITQQVFDQVQNKLPTQFAKLPAVSLKNIRLPMSVYRVVLPWSAEVTGNPMARAGRGFNLAVLPLTNISPDPNDEYFADGLTEELISQLSQVRDLSVIARTSVLPYKSAPKSIAQVGSELGVDTVLEGSVRKAGQRMRITLQLIDVDTQHHIWASSYDRDVGDVFAVQTDIAERTAGALRLELAKPAGAHSGRQPTADPEAYDLYLRGLVAASDPDENDVPVAVRFFERATQIDPEFAEPYAAWANLYVVAAGDYLPMREVMPKARALVDRALELDPESSDAHAALANILLQFDHDWDRAEEEFEKAIALNPSNAVAHRFYALLLMVLERWDEAKEISRRAIRLDPGRENQQTTLAYLELESGNYDAAFDYALKARDNLPDSVRRHVMLGFFSLTAGRKADALREAETPLTGASDEDRFDHALLNALVGRPEEARLVIAEVERGEAKSYTSATHLAMLYAALGDGPKALDLLEEDFREGDRILWLFHSATFFDSIREDPRFVALLRQYGLTPRRRRGSTVPPS
jgi:adenylate cyclase